MNESKQINKPWLFTFELSLLVLVCGDKHHWSVILNIFVDCRNKVHKIISLPYTYLLRLQETFDASSSVLGVDDPNQFAIVLSNPNVIWTTNALQCFKFKGQNNWFLSTIWIIIINKVNLYVNSNQYEIRKTNIYFWLSSVYKLYTHTHLTKVKLYQSFQTHLSI